MSSVLRIFLEIVSKTAPGGLTKLMGRFIIIKILKSLIDFSNGLKMAQEKIEGGKQNVCKRRPGTTALGEQKPQHLRPSE